MSTQLLIFSTAVVLATAWWALRMQQSRRRRMRRLAQELGASYRGGDRKGLGRRFAELAMWQYGHSHEISDVLESGDAKPPYTCFADTLDVGFGRERVRRVHLATVVETDHHRADVVCVRDGHFSACGPHACYELLAPGVGGSADWQTDGWQVWSRPNEDARTVWERLRDACGRLSGPWLVETRGELVAVCCPGHNEPDEYRRVIQVGLELARSLVAEA